MEPMSWGKVHPDVISVQAMLKDKGFQVPDINMKAYMKARAMTQEFIDFARVIDEKDYETAKEFLDETVAVVKVLETARKKAGIEF